ncbi:MAG TPA: MarR family winged helix-turn-helix transcriptional regulator [Stellaceae bacterium]|nr:MarR family winged helix-turn-helix transcriptional regulator [Stellaceae bacterium]
MNPDPPLPTLLSWALVAFTIELDNEFEHRMPHRTARHGATGGAARAPWLVSFGMWMTCMRFVGEDGITVRELERAARARTNFAGMQRWGYISLDPDPSKGRSKQPRPDALVRATLAGRMAQEIWHPLPADIEERWRDRFGEGEIVCLREHLWSIAGRLPADLPDCLPILGYGLFCSPPPRGRAGEPAPAERSGEDGSLLPLPVLLSRVLLAFALELEADSTVPPAVGANVLRVLKEAGVRSRDLPGLTGVSKEATAMTLGLLEKAGFAVVGPDSADSRTIVVRVTAKGRRAQDAFAERSRASKRVGKPISSATSRRCSWRSPATGTASHHD